MKNRLLTSPGKLPHIGLAVLLAAMSVQAYYTLPFPHHTPLLMASGFSALCIVTSCFLRPLEEKGWISNIIFVAICIASTFLVSSNQQYGIFSFSTTEFFLYWAISLPLLSFRLLFADEKRNRMLVPFLAILCFATLECLHRKLDFSLLHSLIFFFFLFFYVRQTGNLTRGIKDNRKRIVKGVTFGIVLVCGLGIAQLLKGSYADMYFLFATHSSEQISDLDSSGRLHDLKGMLNSPQVILRIQAKHSPGYLRNNVFTSFDGKQWHARQQVRQLLPDKQGNFLLRSGAADNTMHVYPALDNLSSLPHPVNTRRINCTAPSISLNNDGTIATEKGLAKAYTLFFGGQAGKETGSIPEEYLELPPDWKNKLYKITGDAIPKQDLCSENH